MIQSHIDWEAAAELLLGYSFPTEPECLPVSQVLGRILAADCVAHTPIPPFDKSPFDGYACRTADVPGTLRVIGTAAAGCRELPALSRGEALRIFTGAPVPPGADAVIRQEDAEADGATVNIRQPVPTGTNILRRGEDLRESQQMLSRGTRLEPGHLGLLASQGIAEVKVFRRPSVCLIPTGSELAEPGGICGPYGIYNSSSYVLVAYLEKMGFAVARQPIVPDEEDATLSAVRSALESPADLVLTTGGASVGDYDFAERTASALGSVRLFRKVNMKPGGALLASLWKGKLLINLSGNPAAALMSLLTVLRPALKGMTGAQEADEYWTLPVREPMPKTSSAVRMLRGHLLVEDGRAWFQEHQGRGNGNIASFAGCELIGIVPGNSAPLEKGDEIRVLRLPPYLL